MICRPVLGVDPAATFGPHLAAERDALRALRERGVLVAAYSPAGPGAVLMFDVSDIDAARALTAGLPLATAGLIDVELIELHPLEV